MNILTAFLFVIVALSNLVCLWAIVRTVVDTKDVVSRTGMVFLLCVLLTDVGIAGGGLCLW